MKMQQIFNKKGIRGGIQAVLRSKKIVKIFINTWLHIHWPLKLL